SDRANPAHAAAHARNNRAEKERRLCHQQQRTSRYSPAHLRSVAQTQGDAGCDRACPTRDSARRTGKGAEGVGQGAWRQGSGQVPRRVRFRRRHSALQPAQSAQGTVRTLSFGAHAPCTRTQTMRIRSLRSKPPRGVEQMKFEICIDVDDIDRAVEFYGRGLGLNVVESHPGWAQVKINDQTAWLMKIPAGRQGAITRDYRRHWTP